MLGLKYRFENYVSRDPANTLRLPEMLHLATKGLEWQNEMAAPFGATTCHSLSRVALVLFGPEAATFAYIISRKRTARHGTYLGIDVLLGVGIVATRMRFVISNSWRSNYDERNQEQYPMHGVSPH